MTSLRRSSSDSAFGYLLAAPALLMLAVFALYPALETVRLSLHRMVLTMPWLGEDFVGLENYVLLWRDGAMWSSLAVTLIFVAVTTAVELGAGLVTALVMNESFRWRGIFRAAVLVPWALPTVVASQMWRLLFNDRYGFVNYVLYGPSTELYRAWLADPASALAAVMIADIWKTSSFAALIILAGLQAIDDDLYRAAALDGAGPWRRFRLITLPLLRPALLVALLFRTIDAFRVFDLVFVMTQGGPADSTSVLQFYGYKQLFAYGDMGYGSAVSTFIFVVILLVSLFYVRFVAPAALSGERRP